MLTQDTLYLMAHRLGIKTILVLLIKHYHFKGLRKGISNIFYPKF